MVRARTREVCRLPTVPMAQPPAHVVSRGGLLGHPEQGGQA